MIFSNPVRQALIRPPGSPAIAGDFRVTQDFGLTSVTAEPSMNWPGGEGIPAGQYAHFHRGTDLGDRRCGADVLAAHEGVVKRAGKASDGAIRVIIDHGGGWRTRYWHLQDKAVSAGQEVAEGALIGHVGSTGKSTACHLHFAVKFNGKLVDPWPRLAQNVTVHPAELDAINIRETEGTVGTTVLGPKFATTLAGAIIRVSDGADLGAVVTPRAWGGTAIGATYTLDGVDGATWERIELDGAFRFIATPLVELSAT